MNGVPPRYAAEIELDMGEAAIVFAKDGRAILVWGGGAEAQEDAFQSVSAGNLAGTYAYVLLTQGGEAATQFMREAVGTGQEPTH